jgi:Ca2+-binding EF-hand superfamily protein
MHDLTPFSKNFKEKFLLVGKSRLSYQDQLSLTNTKSPVKDTQQQKNVEDIKRVEVVSFTIQNKFTSLQQAFGFFDVQSCQKLSIKDFNTGLYRLHVTLPVPDIIRVFAYADKNLRGWLDMEDFKTLYYYQPRFLTTNT